jgi:hypothetical protein
MSSFFNGPPSSVLLTEVNVGAMNVAGTSNMSGDINIAGNLNTTGVTLSDNVVSNQATVNEVLTVNGNIVVANNRAIVSSDPSGTIYIGDTNQTVVFRGNSIDITGAQDLVLNDTLTVNGRSTLNGDIYAKRIVANNSGSCNLNGTFTGENNSSINLISASSVQAPNVAISDNSNKVATTSAVKAVTDTFATSSSPSISNPTFTGTVTATNATFSNGTYSGPTLSGIVNGGGASSVSAPTVAISDNSTKVATTAAVKAVTDLLAPKANPTFSGTITATGTTLNASTLTATTVALDNTTNVATNAAVKAVTDLLAPKANPTFSGTITATGTTLNAGTLTATTVAIDNTTNVATNAAVKTVTDLLAPKASPTFSGTITATGTTLNAGTISGATINGGSTLRVANDAVFTNTAKSVTAYSSQALKISQSTVDPSANAALTALNSTVLDMYTSLKALGLFN